MFVTNPHYQTIAAHYGDRQAKRSGVFYMQHIDHGLLVLDAIGATLKAKEAFCLHPIVQVDSDLQSAFSTDSVLLRYDIHPYALALAMEYRWIANLFLSHHTITKIDDIVLSPLAEVQQMLIADKVQNRKDFERYHQATHPRATQLQQYFQLWLRRLDISEQEYQRLITCIDSSI